MKKVLLAAAIAVFFLLAGAGVGIWLFFHRSLPKDAGELKLAGLSSDVRVMIDHWGVPHVFAENDNDLFFAVGFLHARERMAQLDLMRRLGYGRLSEVFGSKTLEIDKSLRSYGLREAVLRDYEILNSDLKGLLSCYCQGVNAWMSSRKFNWPPEFLLLRYRPEPWSILDTIMIKELIALDLCTDYQSEMARQKVAEKIGMDKALQILEADLGVSAGEEWLPLELGQRNFPSPPGGSNNWVLAGKRTESGKPLLANDPHLGISLPSIWYEVHLRSPGLNVVGVTFPGVPLVVIGHNDFIAWGLTNSAADVQDLYIEKLNEAKDSYLDHEEWKPLLIKEEVIQIKGKSEPVRMAISWTSRGPIVSPVLVKSQIPLSLRWTVHEGGRILEAGYRLNRARNWEEFCQAVSLWDTPSQNFVYADIEGNIGYYLSGRIPLRDRAAALFPAPGWKAEAQWTGYIGESQKPNLLNPESGYIVTANQKIVPEGYPFYVSCDFMLPFRAERIEELIRRKEKHTVETFKKIQNDLFSKRAELILPYVRSAEVGEGKARQAQEILSRWNLEMTSGKEAALFAVFMNILEREAFSDELGGVLEEFSGHVFDREAGILRILPDAASPWFDNLETPSVEGRDALFSGSLAKAYAWLEQRYGPAEKWDWMKMHALRYTHALGQVPVLGFFNRGPYPLDGDPFCVRASSWPRASLDFATNHGVSYRQIIDLSDFRKSVCITTSGQSGHLLSRHYDDQIPLWLKGEYRPMLFYREDIEAGASAVLLLKPPSK